MCSNCIDSLSLSLYCVGPQCCIHSTQWQSVDQLFLFIQIITIMSRMNQSTNYNGVMLSIKNKPHVTEDTY